jgi:hypothetical protein
MTGSSVRRCSLKATKAASKLRISAEGPTHTQGVQTVGIAEQHLVVGLTSCRDLCTAVFQDNINMHRKETVDEGIDWIHVAGDKGKVVGCFVRQIKVFTV